MNVLVASDDSAYRRVTAFLLSRRGFATTELPPSCLARILGDSIADHEALVFDLDGVADQLPAAIPILQDSNPDLAVMVVSRDRDAALWSEDHGLRFFPKWDSFDELIVELDGLRLATGRA